MRRTDPAKLRYPAGFIAVLGGGEAVGGSGVVEGEVVNAASLLSSGFSE
jgi:hypothetical protein